MLKAKELTFSCSPVILNTGPENPPERRSRMHPRRLSTAAVQERNWKAWDGKKLFPVVCQWVFSSDEVKILIPHCVLFLALCKYVDATFHFHKMNHGFAWLISSCAWKQNPYFGSTKMNKGWPVVSNHTHPRTHTQTHFCLCEDIHTHIPLPSSLI